MKTLSQIKLAFQSERICLVRKKSSISIQILRDYRVPMRPYAMLITTSGRAYSITICN
jgi:hypothetical protein